MGSAKYRPISTKPIVYYYKKLHRRNKNETVVNKANNYYNKGRCNKNANDLRHLKMIRLSTFCNKNYFKACFFHLESIFTGGSVSV